MRMRSSLHAVWMSVAALTIVTVLNWLVFLQVRHTPPALRGWVRYDLTSTRSYSLAPQTKKVLERLDTAHELVVLHAVEGGRETVEGQRLSHLQDLVAEYARSSPNLTARSVHVVNDAKEAQRVRRAVALCFKQETVQLDDGLQLSLQRGKQLLEKLAALPAPQSDHVIVQGVYGDLVQLRQGLSAFERDARLRLEAPVPDYGSLLLQMHDQMVEAYQRLNRSVQVLKRNHQVDMHSREVMLRLANQLDTLREIPLSAVQAVSGLRPVPSYEVAREALDHAQTVVVLSDKTARVVPAERMYRRVHDKLAKAGAKVYDVGADQFTGEEQLTGALVSMGLSVPPRVVFLTGNAGRSLRGPSGQDQRDEVAGYYQFMADRLRALDYEVEEVSVQKNTALDENNWPRLLAPMRKDQKIAWVICPYVMPRVDKADTLRMEGRHNTIEFVESRMAQGDSVLVLLNQNGLADPARESMVSRVITTKEGRNRHPVEAFLAKYGVRARSWELILHEEQQANMPPVSSADITLAQWETSHVLCEALQGLPIRLRRPFGLDVLPTDGVESSVLLRLRHPRSWSMTLSELEEKSRIFNPETQVDAPAMAVATETDKSRLLVVGDPFWSIDEMTTFGFHPEYAPASSGGAQGMANIPGGSSAWPGNGELFISGVNWLLGMDELVAGGARTRDMRRVEKISPTYRLVSRLLLLLGIPLGVLFLGIEVWRRRRAVV